MVVVFFSLWCLVWCLVWSVRAHRQRRLAEKELAMVRAALAEKDQGFATVCAERDFLASVNKRLSLDVASLAKIARERDEAVARAAELSAEVEALLNGKHMLRCRSKSAIAPDRHARLPSNGPLHRLCARLLERGVFVWHVATPGAEMPAADAPPFPAATATPRELARAEAALRAVEGFGVPQDILALSRDALALGFAPSITQIVRSGVVGCDWLIEVEGELPGDLVARMSLRGFRGRRSHGRKVYRWCSLPEEARDRLPPRIAPKAPAAPRRGPHRALPEGLA